MIYDLPMIVNSHQTIAMLIPLVLISCGLFLLLGLGRENGFAYDESCAGLFGQLASLLESAHQRLRSFLQVRVLQVGNWRFHLYCLSSSNTGGASELSYSCQLSTSTL